MTTHLLATLALAVAGTTLAQTTGAETGFKAEGVTRTGHLQFDAAIATVFPLFTPRGEVHWAEGWNPEIVYPTDREIAEGMVFRTRDYGDMRLTWTVARYDPANHFVSYNVVAPDFLVRRIEVRCRPAERSRTEVEVTDSYVGLSEHGNQFIGNLTEANYAAKMAHWKEAIGRYLAGAAKSAR